MRIVHQYDRVSSYTLYPPYALNSVSYTDYFHYTNNAPAYYNFFSRIFTSQELRNEEGTIT